jgi:6-hydroxytryprostatin B O-methyltransferase
MGIPQKVPLDGSVTYKELAGPAQITPELLQRLVRLAALGGFLLEDATGKVRHTAMSAVFHLDRDVADMTHFMCDVDMRAGTYFYDSIRLDPSGKTASQGPAALALHARDYNNETRRTIWEVLENDPVQSARFHSSMTALLASPSHSLKHIVDAMDWSQFPTMVDVRYESIPNHSLASSSPLEFSIYQLIRPQVGGSLGQIALAIVEKTPNLTIIVQDLPDVIKQAKASLPSAQWVSQITFEPHDFFTVQQTKAPAYLLRQILHDWPDEDAQRIVKNLLPAFETGTRLLVADIVLPQSGSISSHMERVLRIYDISMFSIFSSTERTLEQLRNLVEGCDPRLQFEGAHYPEGSALSLVSWIYKSE